MIKLACMKPNMKWLRSTVVQRWSKSSGHFEALFSFMSWESRWILQIYRQHDDGLYSKKRSFGLRVAHRAFGWSKGILARGLSKVSNCIFGDSVMTQANICEDCFGLWNWFFRGFILNPVKSLVSLERPARSLFCETVNLLVL